MGPEARIEEYLRVQVGMVGGIAYKFTSPNRRSVPDRMCVFPTGEIIFVECKAPGKHPTPAQAREIARLRGLRCTVHVVDSKDRVDEVLEKWQ